MENRPFDHEAQDDPTDEAPLKKKKGVSRLTQFLSGIRNKEKEETSEKDTTDEKPKRFRSLFSKLFPKVVENPTQEMSPGEQDHFDPENWFKWMRPMEVEAATTPPEDQPEGERESTPAELPQESEIEKANPAVAENLNEVSVQLTPETPEPLEVPISPEEPVELPSEIVEQELYIREQPQAELTPKVLETTPETPEQPEKETVIERGPGMVLPVALVGLEHLGRKKADKKLEKRVNEKITATNKEVTRNAVLQQELETLTRQNQEQLEALKQARDIEAAKLNQAVEQTEKSASERIVNMPEVKQPSPEAIKEVIQEKVVQTPRTQEQQKPKEEIQPEKILEQVADAAEQNLAVERIFERSHEVKDDQTVPGAAASVGAVMAARANNMPQSMPLPSGAARDYTPQGVPNEVATEAYRQAVKRGFWSAVVIIILGSIAYLVIK